MVVYDLGTLRDGFKLELDVTGLTYWGGKIYSPNERISQKKAIELVKKSKIVAEGKVYNPSSPQWGLLPILFAEVKRILKKNLKLSHNELRELKLYIAIGSELDFFHGVDLFFTLRNAIVMIDITMRNKRGMVIRPDDVLDGFKRVSRKIASELGFQYKQYRWIHTRSGKNTKP